MYECHMLLLSHDYFFLHSSCLGSMSTFQKNTTKETHRKIYTPPPAYDVDGIVDQLKYATNLPPALRSHFVQLDADTDTREFLAECLRKYGGCNIRAWLTSMLRSALGNFMAHTDVIGLLNCGLMHVISRNQLKTLLEQSHINAPLDVNTLLTPLDLAIRQDKELSNSSPTNTKKAKKSSVAGVTSSSLSSSLNPTITNANTLFGVSEPVEINSSDAEIDVDTASTLLNRRQPDSERQNATDLGSFLDIGAGSGRIAQLVSPLFSRVECTEVSAPMCRAIENKGFVAHKTHDIKSLPKELTYDNIALLNLIDRCDCPISLLKDLHQRLTPQGRLIIAVPLPLRPAVERGNQWDKPKELIAPPGCYCQFDFEDSLHRLIVDVIDPCGYDVRVVSRVPYLSEGNTKRPYYVLDDLLLVLSKK